MQRLHRRWVAYFSIFIKAIVDYVHIFRTEQSTYFEDVSRSKKPEVPWLV